jgi:hypothetical protein
MHAALEGCGNEVTVDEIGFIALVEIQDILGFHFTN